MNNTMQKILDDGVATGVFPNAELLVAQASKLSIHLTAGNFLAYINPIFDLASLTKPLCTALLVLIFVQEKKINLDDTVGHFLSTSTLDHVTIRTLLNHTSGLTDWAPLYADKISGTKVDFLRNKEIILDLILNDDYFLREAGKTVYSDIDYIVLGEILEAAGKKTLDVLYCDFITSKLNLDDSLFFVPLAAPVKHDEKRFLPSENCPFRKRVICGAVMDKNCFAMGGVTGHAGLFGNASVVHALLCELRRARLGKSQLISAQTFETFCLPDPKRAWESRYFTLGFDTPTKGVSQSGSLFSKNSIGHLGYSGTSFWWDLERDLWIIFLTNRSMPNRKNFKIQQFRPMLHDAVMSQIT